MVRGYPGQVVVMPSTMTVSGDTHIQIDHYAKVFYMEKYIQFRATIQLHLLININFVRAF
jgi:hypothetical protein